MEAWEADTGHGGQACVRKGVFVLLVLRICACYP